MSQRFRSVPDSAAAFIRILTILVALAAGTASDAAEESISKLTDALRGADEPARIEAIDALGRAGPAAKSAVKDLTAQLSDPSPNVRAHAAHALKSLGPAAQDATPAVIRAVGDPDTHVRRMAILALESIHPEPAGVTAALTKALEDSEPAVRIAALNALTEEGEAAVPALAKALANPKTRYWALLALGELGPQAKSAIGDLIPLLKDERAEIRRETLITLSRMGPDAAPAVQAIILALADDPHPTVRDSAALALGRMGPGAAAAADALTKATHDPDEMLKVVSLWALARVEPTNDAARKEAIAKLTAALKNANPRVQVMALKGLVDLNSAPEKLVPLLTNIIAEAKGEGALVDEALGALSVMGENGAPGLIAALKSPEARGRAAMLLAQIGPKAGGAVSALAAALDDKNPEVRREILFALANMGSSATTAERAIAKELEDPESRVRAGAAYALGRIGEPARAALPQLRSALESTDPLLRVISAWALVHVAPHDPQVAREAAPVLIIGLQNSNTDVRRGAAEALGLLGPAARAAAQPLQQVAARDVDETVRKTAAAALDRITGAAPEAPRKGGPRK